MSFLWSNVFRVGLGLIGGWGKIGLVGGVIALAAGTVYVKGRTHGYASAEKDLRPVINTLKTEKKELLGAVNDIQRLEKEIDEELEKSRKAADAVKPVRSGKPAERMRQLKAYPGCRDCQ